MKRLDHPNIIQLIEVLINPEEDSIYMVLEMCKKGATINIGIGDRSDPIPVEICRRWFRDMISAIGYCKALSPLKLSFLLMGDQYTI